MLGKNIIKTIGKTGVVRLERVTKGLGIDIYAKIEATNPGGSVKDRVAYSIIKGALEAGELKPGGLIIEASSGNTGIGLAMVAAHYGLRLILTMPETMSLERRQLIRSYGAEIVLTPGSEGMGGAIRRAEELLVEHPGAFWADQFSNPANPHAHFLGTGQEMVQAVRGHDIDAFLFVVGTGGTLTGAGRALHQFGVKPHIVAVEPTKSPVISGGVAGPHKIQGIGAGFVPANLDMSLVDEVVQVDDEEAFDWARRLAREEGLLVGISSGAALAASVKYAKGREGLKLFTLFPDSGERYLSTELFSYD
jgi:cysteine synthase A